MSDSLPKGFLCFCEHKNTFDSYVFAHWSERLKGKCEKCKRPVYVRSGHAFPVRRRRTDTRTSFKPL